MRILSSQAAISLQPFFISLLVHKRNLGFQREIIICHHKRWKSRAVLQNRNSNFTEATLAPLFIAVSNFDCCVWSNVCGYIFFFRGVYFSPVLRQPWTAVMRLCSSCSAAQCIYASPPFSSLHHWRDVASRRSYPKTFCLSLQIFFSLPSSTRLL